MQTAFCSEALMFACEHIATEPRYVNTRGTHQHTITFLIVQYLVCVKKTTLK